jgi:carbamoyltransferase
MFILGISCYYHDAAACLIKDGKIIAAAEEERFTRKKHDTRFPINAINFCLKEARITGNQLDHVVFYEKPLIKFERILSQHIQAFPFSFPTFFKTIPSWLNEKLRIPRTLKKRIGYKKDILYLDHHLSHAASSFLVSPFKKSAILTIDGVGEWATTTMGIAEDNNITLKKEIHFPHSLGLLYSTITAFLGFKVNNDEYKVMGLSPYGKPIYYEKFKKIITLLKDGSYKLDMSYFVYHYRSKMPSRKLSKLLGPPRKPESKLEQKHKDIAASLQKITEETIYHMLNQLYKETKTPYLCMAGGVCLNSVANGKIKKNTPFKHIFIQPAASDAGTALGAAFYVYNTILDNKREYVMEDAYFGPEFSNKSIKKFLNENSIKHSEFKDDQDLIKTTASLIWKNKVIGWFQGKMEWGPRALGSRSILSNACNPNMQEILNLKVKHRECYDEKTEILTRDGWKFFSELKKNEEVATLNPKNNELEYQRIEKKVKHNYTGNMVHFKNKRIDLMVTPDHKVWAKHITNHQKGHAYEKKFTLIYANDLLGKEHVQRKAIHKWSGKEKEHFSLPKIRKSKYDPRPQINRISMDLWLEFLGYYLSEGSITYHEGHYRIYIAQSKHSKYYRRIEMCLNKIAKWNYNVGCFRLCHKQLFEYLSQFGKANDKFIPRELLELSERQLRILFGALMCGDGTSRGKQLKYTTVSNRLAENVQELGIKLGYSVSTLKDKRRNPNHNDIYSVRLNKGSEISWVRKSQSFLEKYSGKVYCVSVPKYHLLCVKRNDKIVFSGNSFRPFAPAVPAEDAKKYFELDKEDEKFMLFVYPIKKAYHKKIPAVTHVDGSGRLQTITKQQNPLYHGVIKAFGKHSGIPIVINTSFNIRGEPIVCTPYDAYRCMMGTGIDYLIIGNFLVKRADNPKDMWDSEGLAND